MTYTFNRELTLDNSWDVIVAGAGPAGCSAAISAARGGAKTLLIESGMMLGGMASAGMVPMLWANDIKIYSGLTRDIYERCAANKYDFDNQNYRWIRILPENVKTAYDELTADAGVSVAYNTTLAAVEAKDGQVEALVVNDKSGLYALQAKVYIDGTGDGDLAVWAGAEFMSGDDASGELMPATLCFQIIGVDDDAIKGNRELVDEIIGLTEKSDRFNLIKDRHINISKLKDGIYGFNAGHIWDYDNTKPEDLNSAMPVGRQLAMQIYTALKEVNPEAFEKSTLLCTAPMMGTRETRRIKGDYVLTYEDYVEKKTFSDEISKNNYPIDIHTAKSEQEQSAKGELNVMQRFKHYEDDESHGVPYRCLLPVGVSNVFITGRSISTDRTVQASVRIMGTCMQTGAAAGIAASLMVKESLENTRDIDVEKLRTVLKENGTYLP
ncbi:MAG: FAD-dependent oxidoreductase [Planctomycetota bacterium]